MSENLTDWILVSKFQEKNQDLEQEVYRIQEVALDVGLNPEMVIAVNEVEDGFELLVHPEFFSYFQR